MCRSSVLTMVISVTTIFIISVFMSKVFFFANVADFSLFHAISAGCLLILSFSSFQSCLSLLRVLLRIFFMQSSPLYTSCLFSIPSNDHMIDTEFPQGMCSATFVVDDFSKLFLQLYILLIKISGSA